MARTRTLAQLRSDLEYLADIQNLTSRHDTANKNRAINQAIQAFREKLSAEGIAHYLQPNTVTLTPGATSPYPFGVLDLSAFSPQVVRVYRVHVTVDNRVYDLEGVEFTEVTRYQDDWSGIRSGIPVAFASQTTYKLALMPPPDGAYSAVVWYLPVLPDLSNDSDTFDGVAGWEDWVVLDAAVRIANRDRDQTQIALLKEERVIRWAEIIHSASRVNRATTTRRRDTVGERVLRERYAKWRLP